MALRTLLFLLTNLAVVLTIGLLLGTLTSLGILPPDLPLLPLLISCFAWGVVGAWVSLLLSAESAKRMMGIQLINDGGGGGSERWLHTTVARLADKAGLPMPEVGVYASPEWNAFATGPSPDRALVAVSTGLLQGMPEEEVEAVLGHEMSHVGNGDMVTMTLLQGVINAFVMFLSRAVALALPSRQSDERGSAPPPTMLLIWPLEVIFGVLGSLVTAWFSRHREFRADAGSARLTSPGAMASALARLGQMENLQDPRDEPTLATLKINEPPGFLRLFASHPPIEARIRALRAASLAPLSTP